MTELGFWRSWRIEIEMGFKGCAQKLNRNSKVSLSELYLISWVGFKSFCDCDSVAPWPWLGFHSISVWSVHGFSERENMNCLF